MSNHIDGFEIYKDKHPTNYTYRVTILSEGLLPNSNIKPNPRECEEFIHQVEYTVDPIIEDEIHVDWRLHGHIPNDIVINGTTGLMTGLARLFVDQDLPSNMYYPSEPIVEDGTNYRHNGGFREHTYEFNFTITKISLLQRPPLIPDLEGDTPELESEPEPIPTATMEEAMNDDEVMGCVDELGVIYDKEFTTVAVSILLIRNGNVNNTLFIRTYLDNDDLLPIDVMNVEFDEITMSIEYDRRHICIGDNKYYKEDRDEVLRVHPGPFANCSKGE